jgi:hypothetical protein
MKSSTKGRGTVQSPYTPQNVDGAISHLERVLSSERAHSLFGQTYWRIRVMQVGATPALMHTQRVRLQRLLDLLENATSTSIRQSHVWANAPAEQEHS